MSFDFYFDPPPRPQCLFCGCNRRHHGDGSLADDVEDRVIKINATYNHTAAISKALDFRIGDELQHYRDWMQGKSGEEVIPVLEKVIRKLEAGPDNESDCGGRGTRPSELVEKLINCSYRRPKGIWRWEH